ncbi:phasin family protein [Elstera cyanobacteriorum]|uniref:Phasin n=1 Tax=Elstera cyanobacteriorum TaxID=2022747 RepID=A0A255XRY4_9PROT|nr:phasin family protein [Elstera cyanobacteriorum]MCK6441916.1 phasin family protein [Elstera cyanobacteriorum]OYQ19749.1 phasin [Elstera cyanobacteriorum]GFZ95409.1 phasin [Elstera cyanobacteriorum]
MTKNPFFDIDFTKIAADYKIPGLDVEALVSAQRRNIEAITAANQLAFEGLQAVGRRQAEILRQTLEETAAALRDAVAQGTPEEKLAKQTDLAKQAFEKALSNMKELADLLAKSNQDAASVISARVTASIDEVKSLLANIKK